jgi:hypothetical protein
MFRVWATIFLIFAEPLLFVSQIQLRRNGGLAGSYQFHRLYEIRITLKQKDLGSGIEFGSGASSILFAKYLREFISIEESHEWRNQFLAKISILKFIRPEIYAKLKYSVIVCQRIEYLDSTNYLVCSYTLPDTLLTKKYDFAYIDGPTAWPVNEHLAMGKVVDPTGYLPNVSLLELKFLPSCVLVDGRRATLVHLLRSLERENYDFLIKGSFLKKPKVNPYHSIFITSS